MKTGDVTGGTNSAGVDQSVFAMPEGMTIRYDKPTDDLTNLVTGYHVYGARGAALEGQVDWFLPATANVRFAFDAGPISIAIGRRSFPAMPSAALFGPTSIALKAQSHGGVMVGFGVSALGWSRFFHRPAHSYRNMIVPFDQACDPDFAHDLEARLAAAEHEGEVAAILDAALIDRLGPPHPDEPLILHLMAIIGRDGATDIRMVANELGITTDALRRLSVRHFGFTPKMLLRRARFLRSFLRMFRTREVVDYSAIDPSYFDVSHFLRDANTFLGTTPRRFMARSTPFLDASLRARAAVLGAPTQALHLVTVR